MKLKYSLWICVALLALTYGKSVAQTSAPPMKTIGQLATEEGMDLDHMAKGIPRDFPIPANSHHLEVDNFLTQASVPGMTPQETGEFYQLILPLQGWSILKHLKFNGLGGGTQGPVYTYFSACKADQCVAISCGSSAWGSPANLLRLGFLPRRLLKQ